VRPRRLQIGILTAAIVAELIVLIGHPLFGWGPKSHPAPATPPALTGTAPSPPSAREVLLRLAAAAARQATRTSPPTGRYAYVERQSWRLTDQLVTGPRPSYPLYRVISSWRASNGGGHGITVQRTRHGFRTVTVTLPPSGALPRLSDDRGALAHRLGLGTTGAAGRHVPTSEQLLTFTAIAGEEPVPAAAEANILDLLAGDRDLINAGTARDRAGRRAVVVALAVPTAGTTVRETLLLDPRTGALLEFDRMLAAGGGRGALRTVAQGTLLSYTLYRQAGRVARIGERTS
jgi:hypothetical protein